MVSRTDGVQQLATKVQTLVWKGGENLGQSSLSPECTKCVAIFCCDCDCDFPWSSLSFSTISLFFKFVFFFRFPLLFCAFSLFFSKDFRGSAKRKNPCFFRGFRCFPPKYKGWRVRVLSQVKGSQRFLGPQSVLSPQESLAISPYDGKSQAIAIPFALTAGNRALVNRVLVETDFEASKALFLKAFRSRKNCLD